MNEVCYMKKIFLPILSLMILASCVTAWESGISYYGVWRSDSPEITMFLLPEYRISENPRIIYPGIYVKDGVETDVLVWISLVDASIGIYNASLNPGEIDSSSKAYFSWGRYSFRRFHRDRIYLHNPPSHWRELAGTNRIAFELVESVEVGG